MNAICVVLALTFVTGSDPVSEEIGRFKTHEGCNAAIIDNLDRFDRLVTFELDGAGNPLPPPLFRKPVTYLEGYRPLAFPYVWEPVLPYQRHWKRRHRQ